MKEVVSIPLKRVEYYSSKSIRIVHKDGKQEFIPKAHYFGENFSGTNGQYWVSRWIAEKIGIPELSALPAGKYDPATNQINFITGENSKVISTPVIV